MSATQVLSPAAEPPPGTIVVDDQDNGFARYGTPGYWYEASSPPDPTGWYYDDHIYWSQNNVETVDNYAVWSAPATLSGTAQVWVFIPARHATTEHARYTVYSGGLSATVEINQNIHYGEWVSLGSYLFIQGMDDRVVLVDATGEAGLTKEVGFDAVAFVQYRLYLPLVVRNWTPPTPKQWSGMHMGNRIYADWDSDMLAPFNPETGGKWPRIVVAQSNQVFNINRYDEPDCRIQNISVRNQNLFAYLREAAQAGARVVIRITPSPGNFQESIDPAWPDPLTRPAGRTLITESGVQPGGWFQCGNEWRFRPVNDVGDEMIAIQNYILWQAPPGYGWQAFGFEPANEPNTEWYALGENGTDPSLDEENSWWDMDQYFANLYDYVHDNAGLLPIRVLTPPMAQSAYAETNNINSDDEGCPPFRFSGYSQMSLTFDSAAPKNDGYSWHNYWIAGREEWADCPGGQHVSMWFPDAMESNIQSGERPAIITEADLASPRQGMGNPLTDKDLDSALAAASLRDFLFQEAMAECTAVWLLNDDTGSDTDHTWHQAYTPPDGFRPWFITWWNEDETP